MKTYILISNIKIHNANAMSSPYTIGFPAMTAWLGSVHALERKVHAQGMQEVRFRKTGVVCKECNLQTYKGPGDYRSSIIGTANPLKKSRKTGDFERPPFIEEARCHLRVSLVIEVTGVNSENAGQLQNIVEEQFLCLRIAGGDIEQDKDPEERENRKKNHKIVVDIRFIADEDEKEMRKLLRSLMPGYAVIERRDLMVASMQEGKDALDALLEGLQVVSTSIVDDGELRWEHARKAPGWIVPLAVGFKALAGPVQVENQRDFTYDHYFAESVVTLGEFKMPYHFDSMDEMMWEYQVDTQQGLYLCKNQVKG